MNRFFTILAICILALFCWGVGFFLGRKLPVNLAEKVPSEVIKKVVEKPLEKYSIPNLSKANIKKGEIKIEEEISEEKDFTSYKYVQEINPNLDGKTMQQVSGLINIPKGDGPFPVIVMYRGYVDPSIYSTGVGTRRSAEVFAQNGFITVAPDFLGYADSDENAADVLESRFQTYTTALATLFSVDSMPYWDKKNVFLWAHSNGGTIALTVLEVTGAEIPTVLWAPVSKPFPYSVLYYTDESEDKGKFLRSVFADFEEIYDADQYSIASFWDRIHGPVQLHQGTADDAVPIAWSNQLANILRNVDVSEDEKLDVEYFTYPGADHNMQPGWDEAVSRSLEFYKSHLQ